MNAVTMAHAPGAGRGTRRQAQARTARQARLLLTPAVSVLLVWMIVPLALTLWFSFQRYNLLRPAGGFAGFDNYSYLLGGHDLWRRRSGTPSCWSAACWRPASRSAR